MMKRHMKDSGIDWIGEIPDDWEVEKVKFTIKWKSEKGNPNGEVLSLYRDYGIVPKNSRNDNFNVTSLDTSTYKVVNRGDFVINKMKAWQGSMALSEYDGIVSPAYHVCEFTNDSIDKKYFHYLMRNVSYLPEYRRLSTGLRIGQWDLSFDDFKNLPFLIPPIAEQTEIVSFLNCKIPEIDSIIEKTRSSIEEYKKLKQSVITEAVTKGIRPNRKMKDSGIEWIGEIPDDYIVEKMKHLGTYRNGLTYSPDDICEEKNGILVLRASNIQQGQLSLNDNVYVNLPISDELKVRKGDIIICSRNGSKELIGKCAVIDTEINASFGAFMMVFRNKTPKYLYYVLNSIVFKYYLSSFLTATINQLTGKNFGNMEIVYCDDFDEQQQIVSFLDKKTSEIDSLISKKEKLITELEAYKKSLIYEYVTGKKEVKVDITVEYSTEFKKALLMCRILELTQCKGRIHLQKTFFALDTLLNLFSTQYYRFEHGPYDLNIERYERIIEEKGWLNIYGGKATRYNKTNTFSDYYIEYEKVFGDKDDVIQRICKVFNVPRTTKAEKIATLLAVWNDFLINGIEPTDDMIIDDVMTNWTPNKANIARETWSEFLSKIRENNIIPKGYGKHTKRKEELANGEF